MALLRSRRAISLLILLILVGYLVGGFLMSDKPEPVALVQPEGATPGYAFVTVMHDQMDAQLNSFGGWLPNDLPLTPGWMLDNVPNFQLGVLQVSRHAARVLRDNLTRQRTSDAVNPRTDLAFTAFSNDPHKWAFPSAEGRFSAGNRALMAFRRELEAGTANFYPRSDNLIQLLEPLVSELGGVTTTLLEARTDRVAWMKIDDNFYYAQGVGYAMIGLMEAIRAEFRTVLRDKNAEEITDTIIQSLHDSQFEPVLVTNGSPSGMLANHSSNLKAYLDDARQKMVSLITILDQG